MGYFFTPNSASVASTQLTQLHKWQHFHLKLRRIWSSSAESWIYSMSAAVQLQIISSNYTLWFTSMKQWCGKYILFFVRSSEILHNVTLASFAVNSC